MRRRVFFYVQHLLGVGHLKRASVLARAMAGEGLDVTVALGGPSLPGVDFEGCARVPLPAVHAADETFKLLLDEDDRPIDDAWREKRTTRLLTAFETCAPHLLLIELFPFGRLQFRFELLPLLAAARVATEAPQVVCSLRDVVVRRGDPAKNALMVALAERWFDTILVHGDPRFLPLTASLPEAAALADKITYTGYVVEDDTGAGPRGTEPVGSDEVIVSAGGGIVGEPLLRAAVAARPLTSLADRTWRLITGPNLPIAAFDGLRALIPPGVTLERWRPDLPRLLARCRLSISQAGYNTVMDLLRGPAPAVVVPFAAGNETEQRLRAEALAARGLLVSVDPDRLNAKTLAEGIERALTLPARRVDIDRTGAATTARLVKDLARRPRAREARGSA